MNGLSRLRCWRIACVVVLGVGAGCTRGDSGARRPTIPPRPAVGAETLATRTADTVKPLPPTAEQLAEEAALRDSTATIVGRVTSAVTGLPLHGASLHATHAFGGSNRDGTYELRYVHPGHLMLQASLLGYLPGRRSITPRQGVTDTVDLALRPAPGACCSLRGDWTVRFHVEKPGARDAGARSRSVRGSIRFGEQYADPITPWWDPDPSDPLLHESGRFRVDLARLFGSAHRQGVTTTTVFGGIDSTLYIEAVGTVFDGDSVYVSLIPRMSHGGLGISGTIRGDTVRGRWAQAAYCCAASGRVTMIREREPVR